MVSKPRLMVTGAQGHVGQMVAAHLSESGWDVIGIDRLGENPITCRLIVVTQVEIEAIISVHGTRARLGYGDAGNGLQRVPPYRRIARADPRPFIQLAELANTDRRLHPGQPPVRSD